jgi:hypothetical protein
MSADSSTNFISSFDTLVKQGYQSGSKLAGKVRTKSGVVGSTHRFPKLGKGIALPRIPQTDVVAMNVDHSNVTATLSDWNAPEYVDVLDAAKLNFNEVQELVKTAQMAVGRRLDQMIIDAMAASAYATQVSDDLGGTNSGLNIEKILRAKRLLDDNGVDSEGRVMLTSARAIEQALLEAEITSADYNMLMPLMRGEITKFANFDFIFIESRSEGGIPLATNIRNNFAFHRDAVGLAVGVDMQTSIDRIPEKTSTLINVLFSAGAATIDTDGVIDVLSYES